MKTIDHDTARRMIHARLDGELQAAAAAHLDEHLSGCAACRRYVAETARWDAEMRREFRARPSSTLSLSPSAVQAIRQRVAHERAMMKKFQFLPFSDAAAFALLLALLVGGLALMLSNPDLRVYLTPSSGNAVTAAPATALPTPTATPLPSPTALPPWTQAAPSQSVEAIIPALQALAEQNLAHWLAPGWVHSLSADAGKANTIRTYLNESWLRYASTPGTCPEGLTLVREQAQSDHPVQMQAMLPDGSLGDLLALRSGQGEVSRQSADCPPQAGTTTAGFLARRIAGDPTAAYKGSQDEHLEAVRAWYETLDGRTVLVVFADFATPNNFTPRTIDTYWFDLSSGLAVRHNQKMQQADGTLTAETETTTRTEFLAALPEQDAAQVNAALAELQALAAHPVVVPTATPLAANAAASLDDLNFTEQSPLTDGARIQAILAALRQQQLDRLAQPGWYLYGRSAPVEGDLRNRYNLFHVLEDGQCEMLTYYIQLPEAQRIAVNEILLADGANGQTDIRKGVIEDVVPNNGPCSPQRLDSVMLLENELAELKSLAAGEENADVDVRAWVEMVKGRRVLALAYDLRYRAPKPNTMDPDTRTLVIEDRAQQWKYFDLETGANLGNFYRATLENGKVLAEEPDLDTTPFYELKALTTPPQALLQAFETAKEQLQALLDQKQ